MSSVALLGLYLLWFTLLELLSSLPLLFVFQVGSLEELSLSGSLESESLSGGVACVGVLAATRVGGSGAGVGVGGHYLVG